MIIDFFIMFASVFMAQLLIEISKELINRLKHQTKTIVKSIKPKRTNSKRK